MGGYGSTRWQLHSRKFTVDDCRSLSIFTLNHSGLFKTELYQSGSFVWQNQYFAKTIFSVDFQLNTMTKRPWLHLFYNLTRPNGERHEVDYEIFLRTTPCHFGGFRWWFTCPLSVKGHVCGKRVAKLYLPPGSHYFGCRHCYDLTYKSTQENDKRVNALKKLGAMAILEGITNGEIEPRLGLKALP